jgi:hypothetical protein
VAEWHLSYVRAGDVDRFWGWLRPFIEKAVKKAPTNLTPEDIRDWAKEDRARIWVVQDGWTDIAAFSLREADGAVEFLTFGGTRMGEWLPALFPEFCDLAKRNGVKRLWMGGRLGWKRWLAPLGFVFRGMNDDRVLMEKVL